MHGCQDGSPACGTDEKLTALHGFDQPHGNGINLSGGIHQAAELTGRLRSVESKALNSL